MSGYRQGLIASDWCISLTDSMHVLLHHIHGAKIFCWLSILVFCAESPSWQTSSSMPLMEEEQTTFLMLGPALMAA